MMDQARLAREIARLIEHATGREVSMPLWDGVSQTRNGNPSYEYITSVKVNGDMVMIMTDDGDDILEYSLKAIGPVMKPVEPTEPREPIEEPPAVEATKVEPAINETQRQGIDERIARRTRIEDPVPDEVNIDRTPKRPADNSPTQTSKGKAALRRHNKRQKMQTEGFIDGTFSTDDKKTVAEYISKLDDPISESMYLEEIGTDAAKEINEIIRNTWGGKFVRRHAGVVADWSSIDDNNRVLGEAREIQQEMHDWGVKFCWIEKIAQPGCKLYVVCGDSTPSEIFAEHKERSDTIIIL